MTTAPITSSCHMTSFSVADPRGDMLERTISPRSLIADIAMPFILVKLWSGIPSPSPSPEDKKEKKGVLDRIWAMLTCEGIYHVYWIAHFGFRTTKTDYSSGCPRTSTLAASWLIERRSMGLPWRCKDVCLCLLHSQCKTLFKFV